ncbi:hypothetical protein M9H77_04948 [Catharanthus roseus]|uniref:Uncharacterized protein n=1 Tax=Catharanthus roseus TaxID=4058 RepID=A0ACC0CFL4_CATRO|nr:hypothetical protein M9H77_04948 [Catharanthus roseus]
MEVMDYHGDENVFKKNKNFIVVLRPWIWNATRNLERCINGMKGKILGSENGEEDLDEVRMMRSMIDYMSKEYMENCVMMIVKMDDILDMFDPKFQSILANLLLSNPDTSRISSSSPVSSSSQSSILEDLDTLYDLFLWGEGTGDGLLGGGVLRIGESSGATQDAFLPNALESNMVLDIHSVACGSRHAVLVTKQAEVFSWGDGSGGRLGHGIETDICNPKLIDSLSGLSIESVACGEYHTCAITDSGNLYSWVDGTHNFGLLGHGTGISHWTPKRLTRSDRGFAYFIHFLRPLAFSSYHISGSIIYIWRWVLWCSWS